MSRNCLQFTALLLLQLFFGAGILFGQNLIPDPSFEEMRCDDTGFRSSPNWYYLIISEPDILQFCNKDPKQRPDAEWVNKVPKQGKSICHTSVFSTYINPLANYNNAINVLNSKMVKGHTYYLSFYISLSSRRSLAIAEYGANFLDYLPDTNVSLPDQPNFGHHDVQNSSGLLEDTVGWMKVNDTYTAKGGEWVMALGCMLPYEQVTQKKLNEKDFEWSDYFIDALTLIPFPELPDDTVLCEGQVLEVKPKVPEGAFYEWSNGQKGGSIKVTEPGTYWVMNYSAFDTIYDSIQVSVLPSTAQKPSLTACGVETLEVDLSQDYPGLIQWDNGSTQAQRSFNQAGQYGFSISAPGCSLQDTLSLQWATAPEPLPKKISQCEKKPLWLSNNAEPADSTFWNGLKSDSLQVNTSGVVRRQLFTKGCEFIDSTHINLWPDIRYTPIDTALCPGAPLLLQFDTATVQYFSEKSLRIDRTGSYQIAYANGCDTQQLDIIVSSFEDCGCEVFIPDAFSPNFDLVNDSFKLVSTCAIQSQVFRIYNRWSQLLYESTEAPTWSGLYKGKVAETRQLFFTWSAILNQYGTEHRVYKSGFITLID